MACPGFVWHQLEQFMWRLEQAQCTMKIRGPLLEKQKKVLLKVWNYRTFFFPSVISFSICHYVFYLLCSGGFPCTWGYLLGSHCLAAHHKQPASCQPQDRGFVPWSRVGEAKPGCSPSLGPATPTHSGLATLQEVQPPCRCAWYLDWGRTRALPHRVTCHMCHGCQLRVGMAPAMLQAATSQDTLHVFVCTQAPVWSRGGSSRWVRAGRGARTWGSGWLTSCPENEEPCRSQGSKSLAPVPLSRQASGTDDKFNGKVVRNFETPEHWTPSTSPCERRVLCACTGPTFTALCWRSFQVTHSRGKRVGAGSGLGAGSRLGRVERGLFFVRMGLFLWLRFPCGMHGGWVPRTSVPREPAGSCTAFYGLALEITESLPPDSVSGGIHKAHPGSRREHMDSPSWFWVASF